MDFMTVPDFYKDLGQLGPFLAACSIISVMFVLERFFFWLLFWWRKDEATRRRILSGDTRLGQCKDRVAMVLKELMDRPEEPGIAKAEAERLLVDSRSHLKILNWVATLSTSLGLLGTVVGVSGALQYLSEPAKLTDNLRIALFTTITGLIIYLITYTFQALYTARSQKLRVELKELLGEAQRAARVDHDGPRRIKRPVRTKVTRIRAAS